MLKDIYELESTDQHYYIKLHSVIVADNGASCFITSVSNLRSTCTCQVVIRREVFHLFICI